MADVGREQNFAPGFTVEDELAIVENAGRQSAVDTNAIFSGGQVLPLLVSQAESPAPFRE
jgi:hypothetical protein